MPKTFSAAEHYILSLFQPGTKFVLNDTIYTVYISGKPTCARGEPKTDIYVSAQDDTNNQIELKVSFKQSNANFLENKTNSERAEQLLGAYWSDIITNATIQLRGSFLSRPLVFKRAYGHTDAGAITLGWKFELLNVLSGQLSGDMNLSREQVLNVYSGFNLSDDKLHARVNGVTIPYSGCANCILFEDQPISSAQEAVNCLISIDDYVDANPGVYFACKALNYRSFESRYDGDRPLSVFVDWSVQNNKLHPELIFDRPLEVCGDEACEHLIDAMNYLGIRNANDIDSHNIDAPSVIWG